MTNKTGALLVSALALSALAPIASAQTTGGSAAAASSPQITASGPAIAGVCVISQQGMIAGSMVGKAVAARLQQLEQQASAELKAENDTLQNDAKALQSARASYTQEQLQQKAGSLQQRDTELQRTAQLRQQELESTQQRRFGEVVQDALPIIRQQVQQHNCSVVLDGQGVIAANPAMDLTPAVIAGLNAKITTMTFDREHLDQGGAATAGPTR